MTCFIEIWEPISFEKSRILFLKILKSISDTLKKSRDFFCGINIDIQMCSDDIERVFLHRENIRKTTKKESKKDSSSEVFFTKACTSKKLQWSDYFIECICCITRSTKCRKWEFRYFFPYDFFICHIIESIMVLHTLMISSSHICSYREDFPSTIGTDGKISSHLMFSMIYSIWDGLCECLTCNVRWDIWYYRTRWGRRCICWCHYNGIWRIIRTSRKKYKCKYSDKRKWENIFIHVRN